MPETMSKGTLRTIEQRANQLHTTELASSCLKLIKQIRYLNGCVSRGRGSDIDPIHPLNNVFCYIKELEMSTSDNVHAD